MNNYQNFDIYDNYAEEETLDVQDAQDNVEMDSERVLYGLSV